MSGNIRRLPVHTDLFEILFILFLYLSDWEGSSRTKTEHDCVALATIYAEEDIFWAVQ